MYGRAHLCVQCEELLKLRVTVRKLKDRLREVRKQTFNPDMRWARDRIRDIADLRIKKWREP
jgi:hypothetical protein